jgi:cytochrome c oxidase subunit 1
VPLQIGAPDMSFPRLNGFSYWLYLFGGLTVLSGFLTPEGAASFGWFAYAPLNSMIRSPQLGADLWIVGLATAGLGTILGAVNFITTIITLRAPGHDDVPDADLHLEHPGDVDPGAVRLPGHHRRLLRAAGRPPPRCADLQRRRRRRDPLAAPVLVLRAPEVYIIALPFFGIITEIIPVFSRKPLFGYKGLVFATIAIGALSMTVWAHHMYATGAVLLPFFAFLSFLIAVPTGVKFFNWIGTMWRGQLTYETPMLFCIGFLITFLLGGLTGVLLASPPIDFHVTDTYFVVAHFHYVVFGTAVFAFFGGIYYWFPKFTGRMMDDRLGRVHFWTLFLGFHLTFLVQHWLGNAGMPRRYVDYAATDGFTTLNMVSSVGAFVLGASTLPFIYNVWVSWKRGERALGDDPWGFGNSLEWATSCPPPRHNFVTLPRIRSERPPSTCTTRSSPATTTSTPLPSRGSCMKIEGYLFLVIALIIFPCTGGLRRLLGRPDRHHLPDPVHRAGRHGRLLPRLHGAAHGGSTGGPTGRRHQRGLRRSRLLRAALLVADRPGRCVRRHADRHHHRPVPGHDRHAVPRHRPHGTALRVLRRHQPIAGPDARRPAGARRPSHQRPQVPGRLGPLSGPREGAPGHTPGRQHGRAARPCRAAAGR